MMLMNRVNRSCFPLKDALVDRLVAASHLARRRLTALGSDERVDGFRLRHAYRPFSTRTTILTRPYEHLTVRTMVVVSQHKVDDPLERLDAMGPQTQASIDVRGAEATLLSDSDEQLTITDSCWKRTRQLAQKRNLSLQDVYLRVYVDAGGCSGFSYKFEIDEAPVETAEDVVFSHPNIPDLRVVVDSTSLELIRGSTIDYVEEMIKSSFEVRNNPQSESACGCGSSFALKNFAANPAFD